MARVNWEARSDYEFVQNYKLLQAAFTKHKIQRYIDVSKLIKAKYQDNLEFCQWLKAFYDQSGVFREEYNPSAVRAKGKGGAKALDFFGKTASKYNSKPVPRGTRPRTGASTRSTSGSSATGPRSPMRNRSASGVSSGGGKEKVRSPTNGAPASAAVDAELRKKNDELKTQVDDLTVTLAELEKERDFYFEKLRNVEVMMQVHQEQGAEGDPDRLIEKVFKVLYATAEDSIAVDDNGEFIDEPIENDDAIFDE